MRSAKFLAILFVVALLLVTVIPAGAITDGQLDGDGHPYVGIMIMRDAEGRWRCSGTLISPTVFLTAGHCTYGALDKVQIWFDSDIEQYKTPNPSGTGYIYTNGYPYEGEVSGTAYTHPLFNFPLYDVGVVVLDKPVKMSSYGALPTLNQLDALASKRGGQDVTFIAVGYGMQESFPTAAGWQDVALKIRMVAYPKLNQINVPGFTGDFSLLLSNNANTGGTCFGDSGGPNFLGSSNIVAAVTSYGINGNCAGTGGVYRMDRAEPLNWVKSFLGKKYQ